MCDMTHSYVWHNSCICFPRLIPACDMTHSDICHDSFIHVTWLIHMCVMAHSYVRHDSFICVPWLIHASDITHSYGCYNSTSQTNPSDLNPRGERQVDKKNGHAKWFFSSWPWVQNPNQNFWLNPQHTHLHAHKHTRANTHTLTHVYTYTLKPRTKLIDFQTKWKSKPATNGWTRKLIQKAARCGVATINRLLKMTGLFCKTAL